MRWLHKINRYAPLRNFYSFLLFDMYLENFQNTRSVEMRQGENLFSH